MTDPSQDLSELRSAITEVDRSLLKLLRRRMELAASVGKVKAAAGLPVVVRDAEDLVLTRARGEAEACGISEIAMESIFQAILSGSVERQYRVGLDERTRRGGRVLVLGGAGGMGGWFRSFLELVGHHVDSCDPVYLHLPARPGCFGALSQVGPLDPYDFVLVSVPLRRTPSVLEELLRVRPRATVVEIASIKAHLQPVLARAQAEGLQVCSLHPMFGPGKSPYDPLTFVLACQREAEEEKALLLPLLRHPYTHQITIPFPHHDLLMGWLLGLAHLTGMLFGAALASSGLSAEELQACASTTFARQAATARSVLSEDPALYFDIQQLNPYRDTVYEAARGALEELVRLVGNGDQEGFRNLLAGARRALTGEDRE